MPDLPRTVKMLWSRELLETLVTRDEACNRLRLEIGEPDPEGFRVATITVDRDDNPLTVAQERLRAAWERYRDGQITWLKWASWIAVLDEQRSKEG
jgi:hypothetical protein